MNGVVDGKVDDILWRGHRMDDFVLGISTLDGREKAVTTSDIGERKEIRLQGMRLLAYVLTRASFVMH